MQQSQHSHRAPRVSTFPEIELTPNLQASSWMWALWKLAGTSYILQSLFWKFSTFLSLDGSSSSKLYSLMTALPRIETFLAVAFLVSLNRSQLTYSSRISNQQVIYLPIAHSPRERAAKSLRKDWRDEFYWSFPILRGFDYLLYLMSNACDQRQALAIIDNYLSRNERVTKEEKMEFLRVAELMGKNNQHRKLVLHAYSSLKKHLNKQNFTATCKRFLILLDQLLEHSQRRHTFTHYSTAVSDLLVQCYIYVFSLIFQYQVLEAALDWKIYRMLWAKNISDVTFDALRTEISSKYRNFDLNKGFAAQSLERIKKRYARKGFTQSDTRRYMEAQRSDIRSYNQPRLSSQDRHSSENDRKKSVQFGSSPRRMPPPQYPNPYDQPQRRGSSPAATFGGQFGERRSPSGEQYFNPSRNQPIDPRKVVPAPYYDISHAPQPQSQYGFSNFQNNPNFYPPSLNTPYMVNEQSVPMYMDYQRPPPQDYSQPKPIFPPNNFLAPPQPYSSPQVPHREVLPKSRSDSTSYQQKRPGQSFRSLLQKLSYRLFECRQCGILFQSKTNLKVHQEDHVLSAQSEILSKEFNKACQNPGSSSLVEDKVQNLLSIDDWVFGDQPERRQVQQQIAIQKEVNKYTFACYFCQEELEVAWCEALEDWTLKDSVKVRDEDGNISAAHLNCFKEFSPRPGSAV